MNVAATMLVFATVCSQSARADEPVSRGIVLASQACLDDAGWGAVARAAAAARGWRLATCGPSHLASTVGVGGVDHAIVVAMPGEAGRAQSAAWQRAFRAIDDDPFEDALWGIVTGPSPDVAMRIAKRTDPAVLSAALGTTPLPETVFARATWFSEGVQGEVHRRDHGPFVITIDGAEEAAALLQAYVDRSAGPAPSGGTERTA